MAATIALCIDEETRRAPELLGLDGESIESQDWLAIHVNGEEARRSIGSDPGILEAWVASCEDVEPINLAAALKLDRPDLVVKLVEFNGCGSLFSRAHTANIDEVLERAAFMRCYGNAKRERLAQTLRAPSAPATTVHEEPNRSTVSQVGQKASARSSEALALPAPATAMLQSHGFLLPIVSGSGGSGKSSVSVTGAHVAAKMGHRTLLIDCDLQFGDAAILSGTGRAIALDEAAVHPELVERPRAEGANPMVVAAPSRLEDAEAVYRELPHLLDEFANSFDVIVANTGAAWADYHAALLERASAPLFLIDQRATSLWACRHALELCARCGIATGPFQFAVNRCRKGAPLSAIDVSYALQGALVHELADGGPEVEEYLGAGSPNELIASGNPFCESLADLIAKLLPGAPGGTDLPERDGGGKPGKRRGRHGSRRRRW